MPGEGSLESVLLRLYSNNTYNGDFTVTSLSIRIVSVNFGPCFGEEGKALMLAPTRY